MTDSQIKIDEIDVKILSTLLKDARSSFASIARECDVSTNAIVKRFYRLKQSGVITGTTVRLNMKKFEYKFALAIDINIDAHEAHNILEMLKSLPNSLSCYQVVGKYDIHASVLTKSLNDIDKIRNIVKMQKGVKKVWIAASLDEAGCFPENLVIQPTETKKSG